MKVLVIGLGYIGLPTAAILASRGFEVVGFDINESIVNTIKEGKIHIVEPELDMLVKAAVETGQLRAVFKAEAADIYMIAVPTPLKENRKPDISYIKAAAKTIAPMLMKNNLVILESTSPVGTTEKLSKWLTEERSDLKFPVGMTDSDQRIVDVNIAYCPERVLPGQIVRELVQNDRIIGGISKTCSVKAQKVYQQIIDGDCILTNSRTAELCKLTENAFRDVNIAFANELSIISDKHNIDVWELISLANRHPRVNILKPGPGVGGHCIAVDPWFIVDSAPEEAKLIRAARVVNDNKPDFVIKKINETCSLLKKNKSEINIACLGLSFKPDIDDLRESPALAIAENIAQMGFKKIYYVEPNIDFLPANIQFDSTVLASIDEAMSESEIVLLLVDHRDFKSIEPILLLGKQVIDTRGIFSKIINEKPIEKI